MQTPLWPAHKSPHLYLPLMADHEPFSIGGHTASILEPVIKEIIELAATFQPKY